MTIRRTNKFLWKWTSSFTREEDSAGFQLTDGQPHTIGEADGANVQELEGSKITSYTMLVIMLQRTQAISPGYEE